MVLFLLKKNDLLRGKSNNCPTVLSAGFFKYNFSARLSRAVLLTVTRPSLSLNEFQPSRVTVLPVQSFYTIFSLTPQKGRITALQQMFCRCLSVAHARVIETIVRHDFISCCRK